MSLEFLIKKLAGSYFERFGDWKWLKMPAAGIGISEIGALWAQIDWMHVFPAVGLAITAIGTAIIGLWRYYRLTRIEILIKEREADSLLRPAPIVAAPDPAVRMTTPDPDHRP